MKYIFFFLFLGSFCTTLLFGQSQEWSFYNEDNSPLPSNFVRTITQDLDSAIWIGTHAGAVKLKNGQFEVFTTENSGIESNVVQDIIIDSDNTKWFGTIDGLSKYDDTTWTNYTVFNSALHFDNILSLALDSEEYLWIGTASNSPWNTVGGVSRFNREDEWIHYDPDNSGLVSRNVRKVYPVDTAHVWFGGLGGISVKNGETWTTYTSENSPLPYDAVNDIARDEEGWYWITVNDIIGQSGGLVKFDGEADWTIYDTSNSSLTANKAVTVSIDDCGNIWCANPFLNNFDGENWNLLDTINSQLHHYNTTAVFEDNSGNIWVGSVHAGVAVFKNDCYGVSGSTNHLNGQKDISIFPNPFENEINLLSHSEHSGLHNFRLYDSTGRQIEVENNLYLSNGGWKKDLSYLPSGIYFYQLSNKHSVIVTGPLIKR